MFTGINHSCELDRHYPSENYKFAMKMYPLANKKFTDQGRSPERKKRPLEPVSWNDEHSSPLSRFAGCLKLSIIIQAVPLEQPGPARFVQGVSSSNKTERDFCSLG